MAAFGGLKKFKMAAVGVAMVTKVQNGRQIQKSSDLGKMLRIDIHRWFAMVLGIG